MAYDSKQDETDDLKGDEKILAEAHKRYDVCVDDLKEIYAEFQDDIRFDAGEQWEQQIRKDRADSRRPVLTVNRIAPTNNRVINEFRQNRPGITVRGRDSQAKATTADVIEGVVRYICYNSDSETALDTAIGNQIRGGIGYLRVLTDYADDDSFDQEIFIERVKYPLTVYFPLHLCEKIDCSDSPYWFIEKKISKDEFKECYPKIDMQNWPTQTTGHQSWILEDEVVLMEYFVCEKKAKKIYRMPDGSKLDEMPDGVTDDMFADEDKRDTVENEWHWYLLCEHEILDHKEWPGKYAPIIPVIGGEKIVDGKTHYVSLTRYQKDPARMSNYGKSAQAERIALAPLSPYIGAEGQFKGHENKWRVANTIQQPYLEYKPVTLNGQIAGPPMRQSGAGPDPALSEFVAQANDDIKMTSGGYDQQLAAPGVEQSGIAIQQRQQQSDGANFHFFDNACKALRHCFRIVIDLIPTIYDTARVTRILGDDGQEVEVMLNAHLAQAAGQEIHKGNYGADGKAEMYDVTVGKYDVVIDVGPSFTTKKHATAAMMNEAVGKDPQLAPVAAYTSAKAMDASQETIDLIISTMPPAMQQILQSKSQDGNPADKAKIAQQDAALHHMMDLVTQLQQQLKSKMDIERAKTEREIIKSEAEIKKVLIENNHAMNLESHKAAHDVAKVHVQNIHKSAMDSNRLQQPQPASQAAGA